jgi:hypothetical protein
VGGGLACDAGDGCDGRMEFVVFEGDGGVLTGPGRSSTLCFFGKGGGGGGSESRLGDDVFEGLAAREGGTKENWRARPSYGYRT